MTNFLISSSLNSDVEHLIVKYYLTPCEQISYTLVNQAAYKKLQNMHFEELFNERHPNQLKRFQFLADRYPDNSWKVAFFVLETGNCIFTQPFFRVGCSGEIKLLEKKMEEDRAKLRMICGDYYEHPTSPIHLTWSEHAKTKHLLSFDEIVYVETLLKEEKGELQVDFYEVFPDNQSPPWLNLLKYEALEASRKQIVRRLTDTENHCKTLAGNEGPGMMKKGLESFFSPILHEQWRAILHKTNPLTDEDCNHFLVAFRGWSQANHLSLQDAIDQFQKEAGSRGWADAQTKSNFLKLNLKLDDLLFNQLICVHAKEPLENYTIATFESKIGAILYKFPNISHIKIRTQLLTAIYVINNLKDLDSVPDNIQAITETVAKNISRAYAVPPANASRELEGELEDAVKSQSGNKN